MRTQGEGVSGINDKADGSFILVAVIPDPRARFEANASNSLQANVAGLRGSSLRFPPIDCFNNKAWGPQAQAKLTLLSKQTLPSKPFVRTVNGYCIRQTDPQIQIFTKIFEVEIVSCVVCANKDNTGINN